MRTLLVTSRRISLIGLVVTVALWCPPVSGTLKQAKLMGQPVPAHKLTRLYDRENQLRPDLRRLLDSDTVRPKLVSPQSFVISDKPTVENKALRIQITDVGPEGGIVSGLEGYLVNRQDPNQILISTFHNSVFKSNDGGLTWFRSNRGLTTATGELVDVTNIRQSPSDPSTVYAVAWLRPILFGLVFRSTDFGGSWTLTGTLLDGISDFAVNPTSSNIVYVLGFSGSLFSSTDGGATFVQIGNGLPDDFGGFTNIVVTHSNSDLIYVVASEGVYKSTDAGLNFTRLDNSPSLPLQAFPHPTDLNTFFLQADSGSTGMFRTTDGGATFSEVTQGLPPEKLNSFAAFDSINPVMVYVAGDGGLFRSTDGGLTFTPSKLRPEQLGLGAVTVSVDPTNSEVLYVNTFEGNFKSRNGGRSFTEINRGFRASWINCLTFDNQNDPRLYVGNVIGDTVLRTNNRGERYDRLDFPPENGAVQSLAVAKTDSNFIVAATAFGIFRSTDGGRSWEAASTDTGAIFFFHPQVAIDPHNANNVYVSTDALDSNGFLVSGLYRSTDGAQTFTQSGNDVPVAPFFGSMALDPNNPQTIYVAVANALFKSTDGGISFQQIGQNHFLEEIRSILINPQNSQEIYLGGIFDPNGPPFSALSVLRSVDGGTTFSPADAGLPSAIDDQFQNRFVGLTLDPTNPSKLFAWFHEGLFMSEDGAQSWALVEAGETLRRARLGNSAAMVINPKKPNLLYLGGSSILEVELKR
ncbi:MAG TPA: hypothetical protein VIV66_12435 [Pyrinomonadaceae bacterium]